MSRKQFFGENVSGFHIDIDHIKFFGKTCLAESTYISEYCAAYALIKMFKKTLIIIPTFKMKAAILSAKLSPRKAALAITKHQQRKKL
jgi:hypothetical protein